MTNLISRRRALSIAFGASAALAVRAAAAAGNASASAPTKVDEKDSMAVALGYASDAKHVDPKENPAYQAGASCSSCSWYQGKPGDAAGGPCTFFPGKLVAADGWCRMWSKKH